MGSVELQKVAEKMNLKNLTPQIGLLGKEVNVPDINRPALQLTGFFEHFESDRVQVVGYVEYTYCLLYTSNQHDPPCRSDYCSG